jgi:hypothetical protein
MSKGQTKGRYICKVGFYDIYAKDTMRTNKERSGKSEVAITDYTIYHAKSLKENGFKTKDLAVARINELLISKK